MSTCLLRTSFVQYSTVQYSTVDSAALHLLLGDLGEPLVDNAGDLYLVNSRGSAATTYVRQVVVVLTTHQPKCLRLFISLEN